MPRSYSFDHFTAVKPDPSKIGSTNDTLHPVKSETPLPQQEGLHYGQQHAQTVMRAQARRMDRETEQLLDEEASETVEQPPEAEQSSETVEQPLQAEPASETIEPPPEPMQDSGGAPEQEERRPRRRSVTKRVSARKKPAKRAATKQAGTPKRERHTSVGRKSVGKRPATASQKAKTSQPARKATRGTKLASRSSTVARTTRSARKPGAKAKTTRGAARRPTKKR